MARIAFILLVAGIFCSGCQTPQGREADALWQKYGMVRKGMTRSEVYAIEPAPAFTCGTVDGRQMAVWSYGSTFANEEYVQMNVVFGKDGRVDEVHREKGHGHVPHDQAVAAP